FDSADRSGLPLPEDSQATRRLLREIRAALVVSYSTECRWPPDGSCRYLHSRSTPEFPRGSSTGAGTPRIAAYFAAAKAARQISGSRKGNTERHRTQYLHLGDVSGVHRTRRSAVGPDVCGIRGSKFFLDYCTLCLCRQRKPSSAARSVSAA